MLINHANLRSGANKWWFIFKTRTLKPSLLSVQIQQPFGALRIRIIYTVLNQAMLMLLL